MAKSVVGSKERSLASDWLMDGRIKVLSASSVAATTDVGKATTCDGMGDGDAVRRDEGDDEVSWETTSRASDSASVSHVGVTLGT